MNHANGCSQEHTMRKLIEFPEHIREFCKQQGFWMPNTHQTVWCLECARVVGQEDNSERMTMKPQTQQTEQLAAKLEKLKSQLAVAKEALVEVTQKKHLRNTSQLASNPPQSGVAWDLANVARKALEDIATDAGPKDSK